MANEIATEERAKLVAAHLKAECPVFEFVTMKVENSFEGGGGDTVSVKTVDYGAVHDSENGDMTGVDIRAASQSIVLPAPGDASFGVLSNAVAKIQESRVGDKLAGVISHSVQASIVGTGASQFSACNSLGTSLYGGKINMFAGIDWLPSADVPMLRNPQIVSGATLAAPIANGARSISVAFAGAGALKKYTPFTVEGINAVDAYGDDQSIERAFIVSEDTAFAPGTVSIPIAPVWFEKKAAGLKNAAGAGEAGAAVRFPLDEKTYYVGSVWASKAVAVASIKPAPLKGGVESAGSNINGLNVLMTAQADAVKFKNVHRWDVLIGSEPVYQQGALSLYVPVS